MKSGRPEGAPRPACCWRSSRTGRSTATPSSRSCDGAPTVPSTSPRGRSTRRCTASSGPASSTSTWSEVNGRRRRSYSLTAGGKKAAREKRREWTAFALDRPASGGGTGMADDGVIAAYLRELDVQRRSPPRRRRHRRRGRGPPPRGRRAARPRRPTASRSRSRGRRPLRLRRARRPGLCHRSEARSSRAHHPNPRRRTGGHAHPGPARGRASTSTSTSPSTGAASTASGWCC